MGIHHLMAVAVALAMAAPITAGAAATQAPTVQELVVTPHLGPNVDIKSRKIRFDDLKVEEHDGALALLARIRSAARSLCSDPENLYIVYDRQVCTKDAVDRAVARAAIPTLTAVYAAPN